MYALLVSSVLSVAIECTDLPDTIKLEPWQIKTCETLQRDYKDVRLTVIKISDYPSNMPLRSSEPVVGDLLAGRLNVDVVENVGTVATRRRYLLWVVAAKEVLVARRTMHKGDKVNQSDLELKTINVAPFVGLKSFSQQVPENRSLKKTFKKNGIFFDDYLEDAYLVSKMQEIPLVVASGDLRIQTSCIALESALYKGDRIKVRVAGTGAVVEGIVKVDERIYVEI